jgi:hypothetical protein
MNSPFAFSSIVQDGHYPTGFHKKSQCHDLMKMLSGEQRPVFTSCKEHRQI